MKIQQVDHANSRKPVRNRAHRSDETVFSPDTDSEPDHTLLEASVREAFATDPDVATANIHVEAFRDVVQLTGTVAYQHVLERAIILAGGVDGATSIRCCLRVRHGSRR